MFINKLHSISKAFAKNYQLKLQLYSKELLNKWFLKNFNVCFSEIPIDSSLNDQKCSNYRWW